MKLTLSQMTGVKRSPEPRLVTLGDAPVEPFSGWTQHAIPTYAQQYSSCVGHATANWIEMRLRRVLGRDLFKKGEQIDGDAIWWKGRKMFYPKERADDGGLLMDHGFRAAIALGILPPDSGVMTVSVGPGYLSRMLRDQPVLQGTAVSKGWETPNPANGQIPIKSIPNPNAGHATCIVGVIEQSGEPYILFQNSWGREWGMGGYGLLRADQWDQCLLGPVAVCKLPDGWETWDGWRKYVVKV